MSLEFLATIAGLFGENNVSIESVIQEGRGDNAELVLVTHEAAENNLTSSIESISKLRQCELSYFNYQSLYLKSDYISIDSWE